MFKIIFLLNRKIILISDLQFFIRQSFLQILNLNFLLIYDLLQLFNLLIIANRFFLYLNTSLICLFDLICCLIIFNLIYFHRFSVNSHSKTRIILSANLTFDYQAKLMFIGIQFLAYLQQLLPKFIKLAVYFYVLVYIFMFFNVEFGHALIQLIL